MNYGYIEKNIESEHYVLGGITKLPKVILQPNGQWDNYIPADEVQRNEWIETFNCTGYGTCHALAFLFRRLFGEEHNWSERYVGVEAGTYPPGNDPQTVIEIIRKKCGLVDEQVLPFDNSIKTIDDYYSPKPIPWLMEMNGHKFIENYKIGHEWVFDMFTKSKIEAMKEALQYSPLGVSVYAWIIEENYYIRPKNVLDNHWCVIYGYEDGKYWKCYDSYDLSIKFLDWNYDFGRAKRYSIEKIIRINLWTRILNYFKDLIK